MRFDFFFLLNMGHSYTMSWVFFSWKPQSERLIFIIVFPLQFTDSLCLTGKGFATRVVCVGRARVSVRVRVAKLSTASQALGYYTTETTQGGLESDNLPDWLSEKVRWKIRSICLSTTIAFEQQRHETEALLPGMR